MGVTLRCVLVHYYTMIELNNVTFSYPGAATDTLSNLTLRFAPGNIYGLLGANGVGKSTLLYLCCGLLRPKQGSVTLNGTATFERRPSTLSDIFLVAENFELPAVKLDVYVKRTAPFYPRFSYDDLAKYVEAMNLPKELDLGKASMGERKKAMIAVALACNTSVLLMDEPTNGLDIPSKAAFRRILATAASETRTIVISTHQVRDLDRMLDSVVILSAHGLLLNAKMKDLQQGLSFEFTTDAARTIGSLWMQPEVGGYSIVRPRAEGDAETEVNLEALFELIHTNPNALNHD